MTLYFIDWQNDRWQTKVSLCKKKDNRHLVFYYGSLTVILTCMLTKTSIIKLDQDKGPKTNKKKKIFFYSFILGILGVASTICSHFIWNHASVKEITTSIP